MATVEVTFTALPSHVRTARLIAVAVARRARVAEHLLDEVRLAVGEACSRAVALHQRHGLVDPVTLRLSDGDGRLLVEVIDTGPVEALASVDEDELVAALDATVQDLTSDLAGARVPGQRPSPPDPLPPQFGLALITGLVDTVDIDPAGASGTRVAMSWPTVA